MNDYVQYIRIVECMNTWQGEGIDSGRQMTLIRFRECDRVQEGKACPWCDTRVKMRITAEANYPIKTIQDMVLKTGGLMITGGEPTYGSNLDATKILLQNCNYEVVNIETNGYNIIELCDFDQW